MKTFIIALSFISSLFFNELHASPVIDNPAVEAAFETRFAAARDAQWSELDGLYRVRFSLDGLVSNAYFNPEGTLVAVTRLVSPAALPQALRSSLQETLGTRWISDLFVVESEKGRIYYATLQSADGKVVLQSVQGRRWARYHASISL
ncbi:MAG: hypothetical protein EOO12_10735 [Chitinophagaceae bacterium]|nr:MAG: hypothetical protein EOO12_10735 [Chitinophagaceae bacterium]